MGRSQIMERSIESQKEKKKVKQKRVRVLSVITVELFKGHRDESIRLCTQIQGKASNEYVDTQAKRKRNSLPHLGTPIIDKTGLTLTSAEPGLLLDVYVDIVLLVFLILLFFFLL